MAINTLRDDSNLILDLYSLRIFVDFGNDFQEKIRRVTLRKVRIFDALRRENITDIGAVLVKGDRNSYEYRFLAPNQNQVAIVFSI